MKSSLDISNFLEDIFVFPGSPALAGGFFATESTDAKSAKSLQSCLTLCDPIPGILQVRTLEWVAISFSSS